jgi:hypothetical protein
MARRILVRGLTTLAVMSGASLVASCNLALGLDKYVDCPGDPTCPADATCHDGAKDGTETDTDCGGPCSPCADGKGCLTGTDCEDKVCSAGTCRASSCTDGIKNGNETAIDCGGSCSPCAVGKGCIQASDCKSKVCTGGECQPTCMDGEKDGKETAVDCGGSMCMPCPDMEGCQVDGDCQSGICQSTTCAAIDAFSTSFLDPGMGNVIQNVNVTIDPSNNVVLVGAFAGTLNLGGSPLNSMASTSSTPLSGFLGQFDPSGAPAWSTLLSAPDGDVQTAFATTDAMGDVYVNGNIIGTLDVPPSCFPPTTTGGTLVLKTDSFGDCIWANTYDEGPIGGPMVVDGAGDLVMALFSIGGTADFGGGPLMSLGGYTYVVKLDAMGKYQWAKMFGGPGGINPFSVSVDSKNNIVLSGYFEQSVSFGGPALTSQGGDDIFVVKLDPAGNYLWGKSFGDAQNQEGAYSVVDAMDNILLAGDFPGTINLGGQTLTSAGSTDLFAAKLDSSGNHIWSKRFGDASPQVSTGISLDPKGQPVLTGTFAGTVDFGGSTFTSSGGPVMGSDIFLAKFDTAGNHIWSRTFGSAAGQSTTNIALDKTGAAWLAGYFNGTLNFGTSAATALTNPGMTGTDIFLAKLRTP